MVIATKGSAVGNWRNSGDGIKYKPWDWNPHHIDGAGSSTIKYKFTVAQSGSYYITMKSHAAHSTEYNDAWVKFNKGMKAEKPGHSYWTGGWVKAYQNRGSGVYEIFTKDHDPHQLATGHLNAGQVYEIELAGRSSQFAVDRVMLVKCNGNCWRWNGAISGSIYDTTPSRWVGC